jgi:hypothetical protein
MLQFNHGTLTLPGASPLECYLLDSNAPKGIREAPTIDVLVGDEVRTLSATVVQTIIDFAANPRERTELGHDCAAFALACTLGTDLDGIPFGESGYVVNAYREADITDSPPNITPGTVLESAQASYNDVMDASTIPPNAHLMVRASVEDDKDVLYASKPGPVGPVVLHTLDEIANLYPRTMLAKVAVDFRRNRKRP